MQNDIEKLQDILKNDPSNFQVRRELSILLADNGFNEEALSNLKYLTKYFKGENLSLIHQRMVLFGRYICTSKKPKCDECKFNKKCILTK